jgi:hypothetical protein
MFRHQPSAAFSTSNPPPRDEWLLNSLSEHQKTIAEGEKKAHSLYQNYINHVRLAFGITLTFFISLFIAGGALLAGGIYLVLNQSAGTYLRIFNTGVFLCGIILLVALIIKNPTHVIMSHLSRMVEVDVIYTGFLRQIHQTDIAFLKLLSLCDHPTEDELAALSKRMQTTINDTVNLLGLTLNELE